MKEDVYLTAEGIKKLRQELDHLRVTERKGLADRLRSAIEMGDLSENADYIKAKEDQAFIEGRIQELEETLKHAKVIKPGENESGIVKIGSTVIVKEEGYPEETFYIVGSKEADPQNGKISYESPIGKNLLNHSEGDIVRVETPGGFTNFKIIEIK